MKKILLLCLVVIMTFALSALTSAKEHRYNPFDDMFKYQARQERTSGVAKNVFVLFDEQNQQIMAPFTVVYLDKSEQTKNAQADTAKYYAYINFSNPNYFNLLKIQYNGQEYQIIGDTYEDFDREDVYEGDVNYYALKLNKATNKINIYDAD